MVDSYGRFIRWVHMVGSYGGFKWRKNMAIAMAFIERYAIPLLFPVIFSKGGLKCV